MTLTLKPQRVWVIIDPQGRAIPYTAHRSRFMAEEIFSSTNDMEWDEPSKEYRYVSWKEHKKRGYYAWRATLTLDDPTKKPIRKKQ